ncbi:hypothetical protein FSP39_003855 [Pinctada imbricata]|uniref:Tyr recombinase domain-containing protein n=1 Tax=Pinctada imbricata TaxID=66713 RepID=A0AA88YLN7_PINIB|nr:hypothetical protein FSP39_003855 [Pinctada imbricata]
MRGIWRSRPPQPKYTKTWEVNKVLSYLGKLDENASLPLKTLTLKLAMPMALTAAKRCGELARLDIRFMQKSEKEIIFILPTLSKNGKANCQVSFQKLDKDSSVCVIACLEEYLRRTESLRPDNNHSLLLSYVKPHNGVKPCTVARWLKTVMSLSGIDTSIFKAHSTRGASCSKAFNKGVSVAEIMKVADWSSTSTFKKFYKKDCEENKNTFISVVLE